MQNDQPNLFTRDDTFFGVCQGLGEDLAFNPNYLRLALPVLLFFYPAAALGGYAAAGAIVLLSRLLFPAPRIEAAAIGASPAMEREAQEAGARAEPDPVPLAA